MGVSQREYARRRGVFHGAVQYAIKTGKIKPLPDGTIDPERADKEWGEHQATNARVQKAAEEIKIAQASKAKAESVLLELKAKKQLREYIPLSEATITLQVFTRDINNWLASFGTRIAPQLVGKNVQQIALVVDTEIRKTLREQSNGIGQRILKETEKILDSTAD